MANREYPDSPRVGVGAVVLREGRVLLVRRGVAPANGLWAIPGGALELGETLQEGAEREILEETGITIRAGDPVFTCDVLVRDDEGRVRFHYVIVDLAADYVSGEVMGGDDALEARWVAPEELPELPATKTTLKLLRQIGFLSHRCASVRKFGHTHPQLYREKDLRIGIQALQNFPDLVPVRLRSRPDRQHSRGRRFPTACVSRRPIAGDVDEPAALRAAAGAPDGGDPDDIEQLPAAVGDPSFFDDRVVPGDELDLGSRLLVQVFRHSPFLFHLFADAEIGKDPVEDLFRRRPAGDLSERIQGLTDLQGGKFRREAVAQTVPGADEAFGRPLQGDLVTEIGDHRLRRFFRRVSREPSRESPQ